MKWAASSVSSFNCHVFLATSSSSFTPIHHYPLQFSPIPRRKAIIFTQKSPKFRAYNTKSTEKALKKSTSVDSSSSKAEIECIGTGIDVECVTNTNDDDDKLDKKKLEGEIKEREKLGSEMELVGDLWEWVVLISPFFFWGTAMVAMKEVLPKVGPFFVASFRLIPAGMLLIGFAGFKGRPWPSGFNAWLAISLFALVDASCFQGFLAEGLQRTSAGLGSVIIDSQPLTVAVLAALFFDESIGYVGAAGLVLGVIGLLLLEVPTLAIDDTDFSLWGSGEWWMLLSAQSMAIGTVMVRWVSKYADPVMATGWHMLLGGLPLLALSIINNDPAFNGGQNGLSVIDMSALFYTSIFGSAISYGVFFYNATRGSLTKLSSFTFLTPMFASIFGFVYLGESFSNVQLFGAAVTLVAIYLVNYRGSGADSE